MGNKADNGKTECNKIKHGEAKDEKRFLSCGFPGSPASGKSGSWEK